MRSGKSKIRKFMALVVCAALIGGSLPGVVFAEAGDGTDTADIVKETVSEENSSVNEGSSVTVESSGDVKKETSHKTVETASDAVNPEDYIVETMSNAIKPLADGDVWQLESTGNTYDSFDEALSRAINGDTITLLDNKEEIIEIDSDKNIILDLAGHTLDGGQQNGSVITNKGTLTLIDSSDEKSGSITNGSATDGGGVYNEGTFNMEGGTISNCSAEDGGGVSNNGTFNMKSGTISGNTARSGGGVDNYGTFNMDGGTISNNTAETSDGGGVVVERDSVFNMTRGEISNNTAEYGPGGGIYNYGTFNMQNGTISGNKTYSNGGGVYNRGTFNICGSPVIANNYDKDTNDYNVYLMYGSYIILNGELDDGASIGVTPDTVPTEDNPVQITTAEDGTSYYKTSAQYFFYDGDSSYVGTVNEEGHYVELAKEHVASLTQNGTTTEYTSVQKAVDAAGTDNVPGTVTMLADSTENVTIASGQNITLDLAGFTLDGNKSGSVITNNGTLTLIDSSDDKSGLITNGSADYGGGIRNNGTVIMEGGVISENTASSYGGGVCNAGVTFTMKGGTISGNTASSVGGGVYNQSEFIMGNGTISGNTAYDGGGVCNNQGDFTMVNGMISENTASRYSGGVCNAGTFTMKGGTISENSSDYVGGGVYNQSEFIMEDGAISGNEASSGGGGVCNLYGVFTMKGGTISENTSYRSGGGVFNQGDFTMKDGTINKNISNFVGGGVANLYGTFAMKGGMIRGNTASEDGGGVHNQDDFTMEDGLITENTASYGGGVYNIDNTFTMKGGAIYKNVSEKGADLCSEYGRIALIAANEMSDETGTNFSNYAWFDDSSSSSDPSEYTGDAISPEPVEEDLNLLAAEKGILTYYVNDEAKEPESHKVDVTVEIKSGDDFDISNPHFVGWSTSEGSTTAEYAPGDSYMISAGDTCFYDAYSAHDYVGVVTKDPTCTDEGVMTYTCSICDDNYTEPIKALGHEWEVEQTVIEDSEDRYEERVGMKCTRCGLEYEEEIVVSTESDGTTAHSSLSWSDLISADELAQLFEADAELDFKMTAEAIAESDVPSADRTLAEDLIAAQWPDADYTASWLDISVLLDITHKDGSEETREYSSTLNPVTITVAIPDELLNADGDTYAVIRIHDGEAAVLDTTDNGDGTITFASDLFSSYAIVKTSSGTSGGGTSGGSTSGSGSSSGSDNDDYDYNNTSSTTESPEGHSYAYVKGTWTIDEYGYWRFTSDTGKRYENEWGYIYNPYADVSIGQPEASWFHFGDDGIMDTGWYTDTDGYIYYLNPELDNTQGRMFIGWNWIKAGDGRNLCYYFDETPAGGHYGRLYISTTTPDGYTVDETGAWIENGEQVTR